MALLHLVTAYRNTRCPGVAACIARHFRCLAAHPRAHRIVRENATRSPSSFRRLRRARTCYRRLESTSSVVGVIEVTCDRIRGAARACSILAHMSTQSVSTAPGPADPEQAQPVDFESFP